MSEVWRGKTVPCLAAGMVILAVLSFLFRTEGVTPPKNNPPPPRSVPLDPAQRMMLVVTGRVDQEVPEPIQVSIRLPQIRQGATFIPPNMDLWDPLTGEYRFSLPVSRTAKLTFLGLVIRSKGRLKTVRTGGVKIFREEDRFWASVPTLEMRLPEPGEPRYSSAPRGANFPRRGLTPDHPFRALVEKLLEMEREFREENAKRPKLRRVDLPEEAVTPVIN